MRNTSSRQETLLEIINSEQVYTQEELAQKLAQRGIEATQATLSRDLKALNIIKVPGEGYRQHQTGPVSRSGLHNGILSIEFSGPVAVIKTMVGYAPAIATVLDRNMPEPIIGSVAGDDTLILVVRQGYTISQTIAALSTIFPQIGDRLV